MDEKMDFILQELPPKKSRVLVAMSGGVDSTLAARLLKESGCVVAACTMSLWDGEFLGKACFGEGEIQNIAECKKFCAEQKIEHFVVDVKSQFKKKVLEYFKREYRAGRTPNPCVACNREIKFGSLFEAAKEKFEFDFFCTGHYAKIVRPKIGIFGTGERPFMVASANDCTKDQSYFLGRVLSHILEKVRFPLAKMKKSEVFALARKMNLKAAQKKESQDFASGEDFEKIFSDKPGFGGDIVLLDGKILGRHKGIEHYTVGQRRGLGVSANEPLYVHSIDAKKNCVVLAKKDELFCDALIADDFVWAGGVEPGESFLCEAKIRFASKAAPCRAEKFFGEGNFFGQAWRLVFEKPQWAITPGQAAVLYKEGVVLGCGIIAKSGWGGASGGW